MVGASHPKAAEYNRRAKMRQGILALATLEGWRRIDVLEAFVRPDGSVIVIDTDNRRYVTAELAPVTAAELAPVEERPESKAAEQTKKVYAPKSWDAEKWATVRGQIIDSKLSKDNVRKQFQEGKTIDDKQKRQGIAVVDAMPDVSDWYVHLPVAEG